MGWTVLDRNGLRGPHWTTIGTDGWSFVCLQTLKKHAGHTTILAPDGEEDDGDGGRTRGEKETGEPYHDRLC